MLRAIALLLTLLGLVGPAAGAPIVIGYLGLVDDQRYLPQTAYTGAVLEAGGNPLPAAELALDDTLTAAEVRDVTVVLDAQTVNGAIDAEAKIAAWIAGGVGFVVLDLPGSLVSELAGAVADQKITLINATSADDALRGDCLPNLLHTAASDRMLADALAQYLRTQNWQKILALVGPDAADTARADAFAAAAARLRLSVVAQRHVTTSTDPASREANNTKLLTGGLDYDVVFVADHDGEFARYLPYATALPRPVIGATGLTAHEWHWSLERYGAPQVNSRFARLTGRVMTDADWGVWIAVRAVATAAVRAGSDEPAAIRDTMLSPKFRLDGAKGVSLSFRPWDGQLRMPIVLSTADAVVAVAPLEGFLHQFNTLDTLGTDEAEHTCP